MNKNKYLLAMLQSLIKPAFGCTEIGIIAYACADASKELPGKLVKATVSISQFVFKNVARVGVPKFGKCGPKTIAAVGIIMKNPESKLASMVDITDDIIERAKKMVADDIITLVVEKNVNPVYTRVVLQDDQNNIVDTLIEKNHDNIVHTKLNNTYIRQQYTNTTDEKAFSMKMYSVEDFSLEDIISIAKSWTVEDLSFLKEGIEVNRAISEYGITTNEKNSFTASYKNLDIKPTWKKEIILRCASAIDARMSGCSLPVMSSCDSGDHGLTVCIPQYVYAELNNISELKMLQALGIAHCITWVIKEHIGHLSAFCGSVIAAATATLCGLAYQMDYSIDMINNLINYSICVNGGCLCDGAKTSCTFKVLSAVMSGIDFLEIIRSGAKIDDLDGIVLEDSFKTIANLGHISRSNRVSINTSIVEKISGKN